MASRSDEIKATEKDEILSDETTKASERSQIHNGLELSLSSSLVQISNCATFTRHKGRYIPADQYRLKNSLLAGVGFLELANSGDFAANVWNTIPVPHFAIALMALGGTLALFISYFAFQDARLSGVNIRVLREERRYLQTQKADDDRDMSVPRDLQSQLDINFRELGTELVDRLGMDTVMGFGAICVGVGTFMAIGGANHHVFQASNLLSGYMGNAPVALYGILNAVWSAYVCRRVHRHGKAGAKELTSSSVGLLLKHRVRRVKIHTVINGVTGITACAASLVTATLWYGYVVLVPCICLSFRCNYMWRKRIGYDRPLIRQRIRIDVISIIEELRSIASTRQILEASPSNSLSNLVPDPISIASLVKFLKDNDLFEDFCVQLLQDTSLSTSLFGTLKDEIKVDSQDLIKANKLHLPRLIQIAQTTVSEMGLIRLNQPSGTVSAGSIWVLFVCSRSREHIREVLRC